MNKQSTLSTKPLVLNTYYLRWQLKGGIASKIFEQFSITSDDIQEEIERMIGYGTMDDMGPADYLPYSPKARQVLALAGQEAQQLNALKDWY